MTLKEEDEYWDDTKAAETDVEQGSHRSVGRGGKPGGECVVVVVTLF